MARTTRRAQRQGTTSSGFLGGLLLGLALGAAAMFILDPRMGRRRRALVRDQVVHLANSTGELFSETIPQKANYVSGFAEGARHKAMAAVGREPQSYPDDSQFITDRVKSIVFRDPRIPQGQINVNTVDQVVYLHGHVEDEKLVKEIEERVRHVEGVRDVVNVINRPEVDPSAVRADEIRRGEA